MTLDVLITTAGAYPYPKLCIETLLGGVAQGDKNDTFIYPYGRRMPDGVRILIRDNPASKKDATFEYLLTLVRDFGPERLLLFSPDWAGEHGHNLDFLLGKVTAEWALAVDSDIEFTSTGWLSVLQEFIAEYPGMEVAVEIATANKGEDQAMLPGTPVVERRWIPRSTSYFMLFKPDFIRRERVSFGRNDFDAKLVFQDVFPYPLPAMFGGYEHFRLSCDHGWQLLWAGANLNESKPYTLVQIPPKVAAVYHHHFHKICSFMLSKAEKPNSPTNRAHWGQDIPQIRSVEIQ